MQIAYLNLSAKDPGPAEGDAMVEVKIEVGLD